MLSFVSMISTPRDRILVVENDPVIADLVGRQALQAAGYQVLLVHNAAEAIAKAQESNPEVIIANISLPGLSGKDLLVGLKAQGITIPVIMMGQKGQEAAIIQTFRLGAADYLLLPVREPEIIAAVERLLKQSHERRDRDRLSRQLQQANSELQMRVRELTTIFSIGKAVTTVIDPTTLFEKILDGGASVTQADLGWFLLKEDNGKAFRLAASRNLPPSFLAQGQLLDDGISGLVAMSGEALSIYGEPLRRFKVSSLGQSALIAPVKVQKQVVGLLVVMRKGTTPFNTSDQHLLEAVGDYASISLVNARLFRTIEDRARSLQTQVDNIQIGEKIDHELLQVTRRELSGSLEQARGTLTRLLKDPAWWSAEQRQMLSTLQEHLAQLSQVARSLEIETTPLKNSNNLKEQVRQAVERLQPFAEARRLTLQSEGPAETMTLTQPAGGVVEILEGFISNAIKVSKPGGQIIVHLEKTQAQEAHIFITDCGPGVDPRQAAHIFESTLRADPSPLPFGGIAIGLPMIRDIVTSLQGKVWVDSKPGQGASFHLILPLGKNSIEKSSGFVSAKGKA